MPEQTRLVNGRQWCIIHLKGGNLIFDEERMNESGISEIPPVSPTAAEVYGKQGEGVLAVFDAVDSEESLVKAKNGAQALIEYYLKNDERPLAQALLLAIAEKLKTTSSDYSQWCKNRSKELDKKFDGTARKGLGFGKVLPPNNPDIWEGPTASKKQLGKE